MADGKGILSAQVHSRLAGPDRPMIVQSCTNTRHPRLEHALLGFLEHLLKRLDVQPLFDLALVHLHPLCKSVDE